MNISDVEKRTGLLATTIRYYESRGLVRAGRKENGYRTYDGETVEILRRIRQLRELGISLADIRLWRDGVVTRDELIAKRLRTMDDDSVKNQKCRQICEAILRGETEPFDLTGEAVFREEETAEAVPDCPLLFGIDIGTTSLSSQVIASDSGRPVQTYSFDHHAAISMEECPDAYAADAEKLIERALALIASVTDTYEGIASIGITGQMHGIVCLGENGEILSPLYTWQNEFGLRRPVGKATVCEEVAALTGETIPTGYGIVTYCALRRLGMLPFGTAKIVTIMDLLASRLTGNRPMIHPTNAAAWGAYDLHKNEFKQDALDRLDIPGSLLPEVTADYASAGRYAAKKRALPVAVSIGDNQAGVFGSVADDGMTLINVGTSGQVSRICESPTAGGGDLRPYFDGKYLLSGAALCGGRAYAMLKDFVRDLLGGFGYEVSDRAVYAFLNQAAERGTDDGLTVDTRFSGTRGDPSVRGSISGIGLRNFTPEALSAGILRGIMRELREMYAAMNPDGEETSIAASGNAIRKNPVLREICGDLFGRMPLIPLHTEEAAFGAALYGGISAGLLTREASYARIRYDLG